MTDPEVFGYLDDGAEPLYFAYHPAKSAARGTVLLCSALGLEATHAARVWVSWARHLSHEGWNTVHFDWRGTGESAGDFSEVTFDDWQNDLRRMCHALLAKGHGPIVLLGLRGGALLAAQAFADYLGDALVMWEAPQSGHAHLMEILRRKLAADYALNSVATRKTRDDYVAEIAVGGSVEVEGYPWTKPFWDSLCRVNLPNFGERQTYLAISSATHRVSRPPFWQDTINFSPDLSEWKNKTLSYLADIAKEAALTAGCPSYKEMARFGDVERRISTHRNDGIQLVMTHHSPNQQKSAGAFFPNFGYVPRNGQGGLAVRICDQLALIGVHGIRVDLPGLGDSEGELPSDYDTFAADVRAGSMTPATLSVINHFRCHLGIESVILGGLCAASITALYAFDQSPDFNSGVGADGT